MEWEQESLKSSINLYLRRKNVTKIGAKEIKQQKMTANKLLKALEGYGLDNQPLTIGLLKTILKEMQSEDNHQQLLDSIADLQDNKFREV